MGRDSDTQLSSSRGGAAGFLMASWERHMYFTQGWGRLEAATPLTSSCSLPPWSSWKKYGAASQEDPVAKLY